MFNPIEQGPSFNKKESKAETDPEKVEEEPHLDSVLVFGIKGEEIDNYVEINKEEKEDFLTNLEKLKENDKKRKWVKKTRKMMNVPAKMRAIAALEILKKGDVDELIISGGKTMGEDLPSEAELMRDYIAQKLQNELKRKVENKEISEPEAIKRIEEKLQKIKLEDKATNSIENFANVINMMDNSHKRYKDISLLSNDFHTERLKKLAEKFNIEGKESPANKKLRERSNHYNKFLEKACSLDNPEYENIIKSERRWKRGVDEMPLYFLPQAVYINKERLEKMYQNNKKSIDESLTKKGLTWEEFINLSDKERLKLREVPPEKWEEKIN